MSGRKVPRSGSKAKDGKDREKERPEVGNNNGQLRIPNTTSVAHASRLSQNNNNHSKKEKEEALFVLQHSFISIKLSFAALELDFGATNFIFC